jgi:hypothetical protein
MAGRDTFCMVRIVFVAGVLVFSACSEKKVETPKGAKTAAAPACEEGSTYSAETKACVPDGVVGDDPADPTAFNICKAMFADATLKAEPFKAFTDKFCLVDTDYIKTMREPDRVFTGEGDPKVTMHPEPKETKPGETEMTLYTSLQVDLSPKGYYDLMHLQMFEPAKFDSEGYKSNESLVEYKILTPPKTQTEISYSYEHEGATGAPVKYEATTKFITLKADTAYVITSALSKSISTLLDLKGIIIINKRGDKTEVISGSYQVYENNAQHTQTVDKARSSCGQEMKDSVANAKKAAGAGLTADRE